MWKFLCPVCSLGLLSPLPPPPAFIPFSLSTSLSRSRLGHLLSVNEIIMPTFAGAVAVHMTAHSHHQRIAPSHIYIHIHAHIYMLYKSWGGCPASPTATSVLLCASQSTMKCELCRLDLEWVAPLLSFFFNSINCPLKTLTPTRQATMESTLCQDSA